MFVIVSSELGSADVAAELGLPFEVRFDVLQLVVHRTPRVPVRDA